MKSFKIVGFLVVVLFLGIFWKQNVWAVDASSIECTNKSECYSFCDIAEEESFCTNSKCLCIGCVKSKGYFFDDKTHSCVNLCKSPGTVWNGSRCIFSTSTPSSVGGVSSGAVVDNETSVITGDQRCWTEKECIQHRKDKYNMTDAVAKDGFYSAAEHGDAEKACGKMRGDQFMGFCSPGSVANTTIGFGTVRSFENFGAFIKYFYKYSFVVVGVLGVLMIIVAGVQWLTSAGNQEQVGAAKKRIAGAVIGILILALSYTILNFINPYLVNFRLPQVWILNASIYGTEFCGDLQNLANTQFKEISTTFDEKAIEEEYNQQVFNLSFSDSATFSCGKQFIFNTSPNKFNACQGRFCQGENNVCFGIPNLKKYECHAGVLSGQIKPGKSFFDYITGEGWTDQVMNDVELHAVCKDFRVLQVDGEEELFEDDNGDKQTGYVVAVVNSDLNEVIQECGGPENTLGFLLNPDMDEDYDMTDEAHWLGKDPGDSDSEAKAVDLGDKGTEFFTKLISGTKIGYDLASYNPKNFLIPTTYFVGKEYGKFKLNIIAGDIKDID